MREKALATISLIFGCVLIVVLAHVMWDYFGGKDKVPTWAQIGAIVITSTIIRYTYPRFMAAFFGKGKY